MYLSVQIKKSEERDTWVGSVKTPVLNFGTGHNRRVMRSSPKLDSMPGGESASDSLSLCLSPYFLTLSKTNK